MESIATLVLKDLEFEAKGDCFACESGALAIIKKKLPLSCALGDFDSVSVEDKQIIQEKALAFQTYSSHKDFSDSELAIEYLINLGYHSIYVYGGLGGRVDHQHVNLLLAYKYPQVILVDENQMIYQLSMGEHLLKKEDFDVFSVFSFDEAVISLSECEYPLDYKDIDIHNTLTLSNAWLSENASIVIHKGTVLIMKSKNR